MAKKLSVDQPQPTESDSGAQLTKDVTAEPKPAVVEPEEVTIPVTASDAPASAEVLDLDKHIGAPAMPDVRPGAVAAAREAASAQPAESSAGPVPGKTDSQGRTYDPAIHESPMRLNREGFIACRRGGGSKKGAATASASRINKNPKTETAAPATNEALEAQIRGSAETMAGLVFMAGQVIGGEEFAPRVDATTGENEPEFMTGSFQNYFRAKGVIDIPPGVALASAVVIYAAKRWNAPKFKERRLGWWDNVKRWWNDFKFRRDEKRKRDAERRD